MKMVKEISGSMGTKEMERAIDILVDTMSFSELESGSFDSIVVEKLIGIIHKAMELNQGKIKVA